MPFFLPVFFLLLLGSAPLRAEELLVRELPATDYRAAHEALIESVEAEGLVVGAVLPFDAMLTRTAGDLGHAASPYEHAEVVQFCSSRLAWQMVEEDAAQLALCPLSLVLFQKRGENTVRLAWRSPGATTPGRQAAGELLARLAARCAELARLHW